VLEVETRGFRGPRTYDASGIPLQEDNETIVKERISIRQTAAPPSQDQSHDFPKLDRGNDSRDDAGHDHL
jgi:hypothetical protein